MPFRRTAILVLTLLAFSANSIFCRLALKGGEIDAATFTAVRIFSGAIALWLIVAVPRRASFKNLGGNRMLAVFLFVYAAAFSFAYVDLNAATGGLILFGCVQATMVVLGIVRGERPSAFEWWGLLVALGGLVYLFLPKLEAPTMLGGSLMAVSGVAWGCYSIYGKDSGDPAGSTAGNFARAVPFALAVFLAFVSRVHVSPTGLLLAIVSGAVTSGLGYVLWYESLKWLTPTRAAASQLSVPVIVALGGAAFLGETLTWPLLWSGLLIVSGASLAILGKSRRAVA